MIEAGGDGRFQGGVVAAMMGNLPTDTQLVSVPLSHNTGFTSATMALATGQHLVLMSRFDPEQFLRLITEHRVNYLATVPTIMQRLLPGVPRGRLRPVIGDPMVAPRRPVPAERQGGLDRDPRPGGGVGTLRRHRTSGPDVHQRQRKWLTHRGSVGRGVRGDDGARRRWQRVPTRRGRGRSTCGPGPAAGRPTVTSAVPAKSRDGWDSLGDLGWFDTDGYLYLADRRVDMFTVGGRNVYPPRSRTLSEHPAVLSCLVVGVPHEDLGQVPRMRWCTPSRPERWTRRR